MSDRLTGYLALAVLSCIAAVAVGLVAHTIIRPTEDRLVRFANVGALKLSDPVMQQGVEIGRVKRIDHSGSMALLTLQFVPPQSIYANYAVQVVDLGIMGDRFVAIDCGSADYPAVGPGDTLQGLFMIGTSEALSMVGQLRDAVRGFADFSARLVYGDSAHTPFVARYARAVWFIDSVSRSLVTLTESAEKLISGRMGSLSAMADSASLLASSLSTRGPELIGSLVNTVRTVDSAVVRMDAMVAGLAKAAQTVEGVQGAEMEQRLRLIQTRLRDISELLDDLQRRGVNLRVCPF